MDDSSNPNNNPTPRPATDIGIKISGGKVEANDLVGGNKIVNEGVSPRDNHHSMLLVGGLLLVAFLLFLGFLFIRDWLVARPLPTNSPTFETIIPSAVPTARVQATTSASVPIAQHTATTAACIHPSQNAPSNWRIILCDSFDSNVNGWLVGLDDGKVANMSKEISNSTYRWDVIAHENMYSAALLKNINVKDFYLTVIAKQTAGPLAGRGIAFRKDGSNYYFFGINEQKEYRVIFYQEGEFVDLIPWTPTQAIQPGQANRLTVLAQGSHFTFYINDEKQAAEVENNKLSDGTVGVIVSLDSGNQGSFDFDNFELRVP